MSAKDKRERWRQVLEHIERQSFEGERPGQLLPGMVSADFVRELNRSMDSAGLVARVDHRGRTVLDWLPLPE